MLGLDDNSAAALLGVLGGISVGVLAGVAALAPAGPIAELAVRLALVDALGLGAPAVLGEGGALSAAPEAGLDDGAGAHLSGGLGSGVALGTSGEVLRAFGPGVLPFADLAVLRAVNPVAGAGLVEQAVLVLGARE